jgi:hypothetical protein
MADKHKNDEHKNEQQAETATEQQAETTAVQQAETTTSQATGSTVTEGVRARRGLALKQLIPDQDWIMRNVVGGGKGTRATVGRIWGVAMNTARKQNLVNDQTIESIAVGGIFNAESYVTGEISEGSTCFFPMAYAEKIEALFASQPDIKVIEVDCDIGLEATGKTIPYEWVTTAFREGEEMAVLKRIRGTRARPTNLLAAPDGTPKQLTAPTK